MRLRIPPNGISESDGSPADPPSLPGQQIHWPNLGAQGALGRGHFWRCSPLEADRRFMDFKIGRQVEHKNSFVFHQMLTISKQHAF